jgi:hypothetical protein
VTRKIDVQRHALNAIDLLTDLHKDFRRKCDAALAESGLELYRCHDGEVLVIVNDLSCLTQAYKEYKARRGSGTAEFGIGRR